MAAGAMGSVEEVRPVSSMSGLTASAMARRKKANNAGPSNMAPPPPPQHHHQPQHHQPPPPQQQQHFNHAGPGLRASSGHIAQDRIQSYEDRLEPEEGGFVGDEDPWRRTPISRQGSLGSRRILPIGSGSTSEPRIDPNVFDDDDLDDDDDVDDDDLDETFHH